MSSLLREVIPLALGAAISPVIFLLQLNTLTGARPIARGAALTAGAAIVLIIVSTIGVLVGDTGFSTNDTLKAAINIGFAILLVAVGLRALVWPPKPKGPRPTRNLPASADPSWRAWGAWPRTSPPSRSTPRRWP
jgi:hypothetical protein